MDVRSFFVLLLIIHAVRSLVRPSGDRSKIQVEVEEERPLGSWIITFPKHPTVESILKSKNFVGQKYYPKNSMCSPVFRVDEFNGSVTVADRINRENRSWCGDVNGICMLSCSITIVPAYHNLDLEVIIKDINDNAPEFPMSSVSLNLTYLTPLNAKFQLPLAIDDDSFTFGINNYRLIPGSGRSSVMVEKFHVTPNGDDLELTLVKSLNDPMLIPEETYSFNVVVSDRGTPSLQNSLEVKVKIMAENSHDPGFSSLNYQADIIEDAPDNTEVITVSAVDRDVGENGRVTYKLVEKNHPFSINEKTGLVSLRSPLDREKISRYSLTVEAKDGGKPSRSSSASVMINVLDVNDNIPSIFVTPLGKGPLVENSSPPIAVASVVIKDEDLDQNGYVECYLKDETDSFAIDVLPNIKNKMKNVSFSNLKEFYIYSTSALDSEIARNINITLTCHDNPSEINKSLGTTVIVSVDVLDVNDNDPVFGSNTYSMSIIENSSPGAYIGRVMATDVDEGVNSRVAYKLSNDVSDFFSINSTTGEITSSIVFDREAVSSYHLKIVATDGGNPSRNSTATVIVDILDVNDNLPAFVRSEFVFPVAPSTKPGTVIGTVTAADRDEGENAIVQYKIRKDPKECSEISIDSKNGNLTLTHIANTSRCKVHNFYVDAKNPSLDESSSVQVVVFVKEETDVEPVFAFPKQFDNNSVIVQYPLSKGQEIAKLSASSINSEIRYSLLEIKFSSEYMAPRQPECMDKMFDLDPTTGSMTLLEHRCLDDLDPSHNSTFELKVRAYSVKMSFLRTESVLKIFFDNLPLKTARGFDWADFTSNQNLVIVVAIVASTILLVVALSSVIISLVVRSRRKNVKGSYSCCKPNPKLHINTTFVMGGTKNIVGRRREQVVNSLLQGSRPNVHDAIKSSSASLNEKDSQSSDSGRGPSESEFQYSNNKHQERSSNTTTASLPALRPSYDPLNQHLISPAMLGDPLSCLVDDLYMKKEKNSRTNQHGPRGMMAPSEDFDQLEAQTTTRSNRIRGRRNTSQDSDVGDRQEQIQTSHPHHPYYFPGRGGFRQITSGKSTGHKDAQDRQMFPPPYSTFHNIQSKKVSFDVNNLTRQTHKCII